MKITRKQLKQIIKEEIEATLAEMKGVPAGTGHAIDYGKALKKGIRKSEGDVLGTMAQDIQDVVDWVKSKLGANAAERVMQALASAGDERASRE